MLKFSSSFPLVNKIFDCTHTKTGANLAPASNHFHVVQLNGSSSVVTEAFSVVIYLQLSIVLKQFVFKNNREECDDFFFFCALFSILRKVKTDELSDKNQL